MALVDHDAVARQHRAVAQMLNLMRREHRKLGMRENEMVHLARQVEEACITLCEVRDGHFVQTADRLA